MNVFNHMHPGGGKILQSYAGMDATIAYQKVEHHINSEVDAMLSMYEIGVLHTPSFGQEWGVALSGNQLRTITLCDTFGAWVDMLYMIVEIENAIMNDFRVRHEPLTDAETIDAVSLTPNKVMQLGLAHERLITGYLDHLLGDPIQTLWAITVGLCGETTLDARWMRTQLDAIRATPDAGIAVNLGHAIRERLKADDARFAADSANWERGYAAWCDALEDADRQLLRDLKLAIRDGVRTFETFEQNTIRSGGANLLNALKQIPVLLGVFYRQVAQIDAP